MRTVARVACCVLLVAGSAAPRHDALADAVDDSIRRVQDLDAAGDETKCVAALASLKDSTDAHVVAAVRELLKSTHDQVACAATRMLSGRKDPKCLEWLKGKLDDRETEKDKTARP